MSKEIVPARRGEKGSSLLEVLIALLLLLYLMLGVILMFGMAYLRNMGAAARTEMTYHAQQFAENVRVLNSLYKISGTAVSNTGITFPLTVTSSAQTVNPSTSTYWGASGANVVTTTSPYTVSYQVADGNNGLWVVTVSITPKTTGAARYRGEGISHKTLMYATEIPK